MRDTKVKTGETERQSYKKTETERYRERYRHNTQR